MPPLCHRLLSAALPSPPQRRSALASSAPLCPRLLSAALPSPPQRRSALASSAPLCHEPDGLLLLLLLPLPGVQLPEPVRLLPSAAPAPRPGPQPAGAGVPAVPAVPPVPPVPAAAPAAPARRRAARRGRVHPGQHRLQPAAAGPVARRPALAAPRPLAAGRPGVRPGGGRQAAGELGVLLLRVAHRLLPVPDGGVRPAAPGGQPALPGAAAAAAGAPRRPEGAGAVAAGPRRGAPGPAAPHLLLLHQRPGRPAAGAGHHRRAAAAQPLLLRTRPARRHAQRPQDGAEPEGQRAPGQGVRPHRPHHLLSSRPRSVVSVCGVCVCYYK
ncbi:hypothetical protein EYF80_066601 [Liparis tanakae]|uniref:Uncharacterized protein n=1 Tax=Liparis tanakae TaxID=230148 RepID=A0A4Z2E3H3_9TELE|nr:hypothetical protein EYF80_066601 [Liparis tanakae]